jgi:predicted Zn finger-like uncharacterized protein
MLLTRCPSCNTAFRITAELLKQASGQVRCGRCNHIFAAFAHLEEAQVAADAHGIGSYAPPPETSPPEVADELAETSEHQTLSFELEDDAGPPDQTRKLSSAEPVTADELAEIFDSDPGRAEKAPGDDTLATENKTLLATIDPDDPLDLELPPDEWQAFYASQGLSDDDSEFADVENVVMESADPEADESPDDFPQQPGRAADPAPDAAGTTESAVDFADSLSTQPAAEPQQGESEPVAMTQDDADPAAEPEPFPQPWELASGTMAANLRPSRQRWWGIGAGLLAIALLLQLGHHFRNRLAANATLGPLVRSVYGGMDLDLAPDWDVGQYEIDDWVATAGANETGGGSLTITATLANRGPRDQPHPYVRLELKDRWDEPVGSRIFAPAEYLPQPPAPGELMTAGARVPALLAVVDPGDDAYGFELDVCMPSAGDQLRCANQKVF